MDIDYPFGGKQTCKDTLFFQIMSIFSLSRYTIFFVKTFKGYILSILNDTIFCLILCYCIRSV